MFARNLLASVTAAAILLTALVSRAAPMPPVPAGAVCAKATMVRASDGAIVTRTVCSVALPTARGGK